MKNVIRNTLVVCLGIGLMGCEWQGGGDGNSWNSRYNFVNFSGNYRGSGGGGYLVSEYSGTVVADNSGETSVGQVSGESGGSTEANRVLFTGQTDFKPVVPGTFSIVIGAVDGTASDNGAGVLAGSYKLGVTNLSASGWIQYDTGAWSLQLAPSGISADRPILLTYNYEIGGSSGGSSSGTPGSTAVSIYAFNVQQEGNVLRIVDNNGSVYEGNFGSIRTTGGVDQDSTFATYSDGDQIIGQFEANGSSAANVSVHIVGTFQATITGVTSSSDGSTTSMRLSDRRILGTWIESSGKTGDINGQAVPINVTTTADTTPTP